jgi:hypothetical protein
MAIRIRKVNDITVALCAVETDPQPGDLYLDDTIHYALAAKFAKDWQNHETINWQYPEQWAAMDTQKLRDAEQEIIEWNKNQNNKSEVSENDEDDEEDELDLETCEQCNKNSWDGYICHNCGLKYI